jgi:hypothetical protein
MRVMMAVLAIVAWGGAGHVHVHVQTVTLSNVVPRQDTAGNIINAHAGGIYNFSGTF